MLGKYLGMGNNVVWSYGYSDNPGAGADKTFYAQSTYVQPVQGNDDTYLAMCDRWNKTDLQNSRYVWLPIVWGNDGMPTIPWRDTVELPESKK